MSDTRRKRSRKDQERRKDSSKYKDMDLYQEDMNRLKTFATGERRTSEREQLNYVITQKRMWWQIMIICGLYILGLLALAAWDILS